MDRREAGRRAAEELLWTVRSNMQSRRKELDGARKLWEHQEVAQAFKIPVVYKNLQGNTMKIIPFVEAPRNTNNK